MSSSSRSIAKLFTHALAGCLILSLVPGTLLVPATLLAAAVPGWHSKRAPAVQPLTERRTRNPGAEPADIWAAARRSGANSGDRG